MFSSISLKDAAAALFDVATDKINNVHHQLVKITFGDEGAATPVSSSNPLPVVSSEPADQARSLTDGRKTVGAPGTAVAIRGALACRWVTVTALLTNTQQVNVGGADVLATSGGSVGTPLNAGGSITIPVDDASKVFVDARVAGEGVSFTVGS